MANDEAQKKNKTCHNSRCGAEVLIVNMGGEMVYILAQRLQAQQIPSSKGQKVLCDVVRNWRWEPGVGPGAKTWTWRCRLTVCELENGPVEI